MGDIAIIGHNCDPNTSVSKTFAIVALADLPAGQVVKFSDKAYYATAPGFGPLLGNGSEGIFSWTIPTGGIGKGTVIMFTLTSGATPSVTTTPSSGTTSVIEGWTSTSATVSPFGQNGDNILIYQGTEASPSFVFGFNNGNNTSIVVNGWNTGLAANPNGACELPSTLTNGTTAIGFNTGNSGDQKDNLKYNGIQTGTKAALLAAICNTNNWINDDVIDYNFTPGTGVFTGTNPIFTLTTGATATITTTGILSAFSACSGTASIQQSFTVSGSNLTANIVITPPTGFEVSTTSGSGFTSSVTLTQSSGSVSVTTVYVRLATSASGTPSGNITCTSTGATTQNVAASGTVNALPTITLGSVTNVNTSATSFSLPYSATIGSPDQYSITTGTPTAMPSFSAISNASLPASPISVTIPASAINTYNFVATVRNSTTGCTSSNTNFSVTVVSAGTTINSIVRGTPSAATVNASSVTYNITFGASVTGLTASNFSLTTSGVSGASIGTLSGSGASYTLTVNTGTGSGDITLNLANSTGLNPTISNSLPFVGETYTIDKTGPTVVAQNVNLYLNAAGTRILTAAQVNNGSSDASGIQSLSVSPSSFTCANVGTPATVTLTVIDNLGNSNTGTASVTILDTVRPVVNTQNRTVYLNGSGSVTVSALQLNNGTSDACGVASLSSSQTTFTRSNVGANIVTLTGADLNGNTNTGTATVTVIDPFEVTSLILSNGTLSPTFINTTTSYTSSIPNTISSITLTPTLSLGSTTIQIRINGGSYSSVTNGSASGSLPLNVGSNTIELLLTNGLVTPNTTRTFTITVTRDAATPSISTTGTLNAFNSCSGSASSQQSFTVSGSNLTNDIVITPPAGFEVSTTSGSGFSSSVTLTQSSGSVASTTIYTRLTSLASGTPSGNITCSSTGATTRNVAVSGTVNANPTATTSQTNVSCLGGSNGTLTVNVTGGTSPFTYNRGTGSQSSNSFTGLAATSYTVTVTDANGCTATTPSATITQPVSALSTSSSQTNVSCNTGSNGEATVNPTGGTTPYTYLWNNSATTASITGIIAGSYSCVISDANGCQTTKNFTVTQPTAISATTSQTNVSCNAGSNGSLTVSASGGTSPYSYNRGIGNQLSNSFTGLTANTYTVTVTDANGCTVTAPTATITQPTALSGSTTQTNVSCNGGSNASITLTATGGTGTKTYLWSNASTTKDLAGLVFGTYTVTITDANGCTVNTSATITQPVAMSASVSSQTNVACFGASTGALTVSVTGGTSPFTYNRGTGSQPSNSFTGLAATSYTVTVTDANGCTATTPSATITQPSSAVSATTSQTNVSCNGGSNGVATVSPNGGTTPYTYLWNNSATTASITGIIAGSYSCVVSDANGCQTTKNFTVTQPSAISATTNQTNVACFGGSNGSLTVSASGGTSPYSYNRGIGNQLSNSFSGLVANTYTVTVTDANGCTATVPTATITQPTALSGSSTQTNVSCNGGSNASITLTATGGTGTKTYLWSNAATTKDLAGLVFGTYTVTITDSNGCTANASATITQPAVMSASVSSQTNVACFGASTGALTVSVTGGTSPFTYNRGTGSQPSNSFTGLAATSYTVTVTDANGCTATTPSATITQPISALSTSSSQTNVSCNTGSNGEATVNPNGGTAPYTYLWNNSATTAAITGIIAGSYSCVISDANGCQTTKNFTVTQPSAISATTNQSNVACNGGSNGSLTVSASGGTSPYSYNRGIGNQLSNSFSGLVANTYTVTVTDANGCTATVPTATITQPTALSGSTTQTNVSCNGGSNASITLTATGGTGTKTYLWSNASTTKDLAGLVFGTYTVTITDANGCTGNTSATITQPAAMSASVSSQTNVACFGASTGALTVSVTGGTSPFTYNRGTGSQPSNSFTGLATTSYTVTVTDANGCTATTPSATITQPVSALSTSSSQTNVSCNTGSNGEATVNPTGGTAPYTYLWNNSATTASISGIIAGSYSCVISDANGCQTTKNFTVTQPSAIASTTSQTNVSCNAGSNGSASVSASGGTGTLGYLWSNASTTNSISGVVIGTYTVTITDANSCSTSKSVTITQPETLVASQGTLSNVSCFGGSNGSASVTVSGGTTPYSFDWTGTPIGEGTATASGLVIGNYSVNVVDANGCSTSQNFSIFQPAPLSTSVSTQTNVSCNGGSNGAATISVSGGTSPYSYDWTGTPTGDGTASASGLSAGAYSVLITDNRSCSTTANVTITQPQVLVTTPSNVLNVSCNGGTDGRINTSTTGGTAPYSYNWTPGNPTGDGTSSIVNVPAGAFTLTVQDANGCISTLNQTITEPTVLVSGFDAQTNVLCNGESTGTAAVIPASGGTAPYSYNWTPGNPQGDGTPIATNLSAGTYNCKITDSKGCFVDVPFTLTENAAITSSQSFSVCFGETVTVGTSIYNQSGTYTNVFEAQNGCDSTVTTNLTVRPLISSIQSFTLCNGQSVTVGTSTYNATGTYTDIFTAIDGCDSVVTTSVLVNPTYTINQTIQLCFGGTLTVGTTTYTASGNYTETMQTINGCDSTINTNLTILLASGSTQDVTLCFGETFSIGDSVYSQSGTYTNVFENQYGCDSTVTTNLIIRNENIVNQTITLCAGETYSVGNNVYVQTGVYTNFFATAEGCDSTHTLNLIVKSPVIVTTTLTDATIKANLGGSTYQWINCSNNQAIVGATNQTYTATVDGDYAVIIIYNGCTDTSACITVENVSLTENPSFTFKLYPNPATSNLTIDASSAIETIELLDLSGKVIQSETANANTHNFNVEALSRGMYLVRFTTNGEVVTRQFVKE